MCGIVGIISKNKIQKGIVEKMADAIAHRGPDGCGYYYGDNFAFGHRRLSIIDLSEDGAQPMTYMDRYVITYNGEIYNFIELKEELITYGYIFTTQTDTEVILASFDKWGEKCVERFNGMWAFAIYDKKTNIIFCSRDRFGVKPFYYYKTQDTFIFGSEIKQLLDFADRSVDIETLIDFLVARIHEHNHKTFFKDIVKLQPSHNLIYNLTNHNIEIKKYYEIKFDADINGLEEEDSIEVYRKELNRAITYRLRSDVRVGSCLSGGLDSSSVASMAASMLDDNSDKFVAIHAKSIEKNSDESEYAKIVASTSDLDLNMIEPSIEDFQKYIDEVVYTQEEPFGGPSIFMQYFVMKKAKEVGCKVMLDGQGGDETLLGYERYYPSVYIDIFKKYGISKTLKSVYLSAKHNHKMSIKNIIKYTIGTLLSSIRKKAYILECNFVKKQYIHNFTFLDILADKYTNIFDLQKYEIDSTNLPALLRYEDKNSMRHSVETRLPFLDFRAVEVALNLKNDIKIKDGWTKYILRRIIDGKLPSIITWRKNKLGFNAPDKSWLSSIYGEMKEEILKSKILQSICEMNILSKKYNKMTDLTKWRLYNIAVWERIYNVKI